MRDVPKVKQTATLRTSAVRAATYDVKSFPLRRAQRLHTVKAHVCRAGYGGFDAGADLKQYLYDILENAPIVRLVRIEYNEIVVAGGGLFQSHSRPRGGPAVLSTTRCFPLVPSTKAIGFVFWIFVLSRFRLGSQICNEHAGYLHIASVGAPPW